MYGYKCENNYWQKGSFQGRADPEAYLSWEKGKEREFSFHEYSEQKKFKLAVLDLSGDARTWWAQFERDRRKYGEPPIDTWKELKTVMRRRYAPVQPSKRNEYVSPRHKEQPSRRATWEDEKRVQRHEESHRKQPRETPRAYVKPISFEDIMRTYNELKNDHLKQQVTLKAQKEQDQPKEEDDGIEYAVQGKLLGSNEHDEVHEDLMIVQKDCNRKREKEKNEKNERENTREKNKRENEQKEKERKISSYEKKSGIESELYFEKPMTVHSYKTALLDTNQNNSVLSSSVVSLIQVKDYIPSTIIPYPSAIGVLEETKESPRQVGELIEEGIVDEVMSTSAIDEIIIPKWNETSSMFVDFTLSFYLDKKSGKKCYMLGARQLSISWGDTPLYWRWAPHIHSRFSEVAELLSVYWLDIRGKINTQILSPKTIYETYLVYKLANRSYGLVFARTSVRFVNERDDVPSVECSTAYIQPRRSVRDNQNVEFHRNRKDGWMELKTGEFINDGGDDGEVETRFMEIERLHAKSGLIVEGIEFRPKEGA